MSLIFSSPIVRSLRATGTRWPWPASGTGWPPASAPLRVLGILGVAALVASIYLASLNTRFDFIDDGNLVYPAPPMAWSERLALVWRKIVANYNDLGPFRPVLWVHWETQADMFAGREVAWRACRLAWAWLAAATFLWLLRELGIRRWAAVATVALAMWNPWRGEVWTSLTLAEGVAMPYAMLALVCALRAARSDRPWVWDVVGALAVLAALGCKNTFAVLVPAQMLLRIAPEGHGWAAGLRRHGRRAVLLALTLLLPIVHYVCFRLNWHPGQYPPTGPSLGQLVDMLRTIKGALSLEWLAAGWLMAAMAVTVAGRWVNVWQDYRPAWLAGGVLALLGLAVYLPVRGAAGRYAMPAVWGVDLMVATLLSAAEEVPSIWWRRAGWGAVAAGLVVVAITNLARQEKFAARAALLWQIVETLEQQAPPGSRIDWMAGPDLNAEEGVHVAWHLEGRGRVDLRLRVVSAEGAPLGRVELPAAATEADFLVSVAPPSEADGWRLAREFTVPYWWGRRVFRCSLWER